MWLNRCGRIKKHTEVNFFLPVLIFHLFWVISRYNKLRQVRAFPGPQLRQQSISFFFFFFLANYCQTKRNGGLSDPRLLAASHEETMCNSVRLLFSNSLKVSLRRRFFNKTTLMNVGYQLKRKVKNKKIKKKEAPVTN